MGEASYAVGNRVYNGGSSAPTRGQVDPMGYVDRELNKPSDSRSGLAQAALQQLQQLQGGGTPAPTGAPGMQPPGMPGAPVGTPPAAQRLLTVTPTGKHVFLDTLLQPQEPQDPMAQIAQMAQQLGPQLGMGQ